MKQILLSANKIKRKLPVISIFLATTMLSPTLCAGLTSCTSTNSKSWNINGVTLPSTIELIRSEIWEIQGTGFQQTDLLQLSSSQTSYKLSAVGVDDTSISFAVPDDITTGTYTLSLLREDNSLLLGTINLSIKSSTNVPDKEGMTLKGIVSCNGIGLSGVTVSDGVEVTTTDKNGVYYLPSQKKNGYVFISTPANYDVYTQDNAPQFFERLDGGSKVEQKDFSLIYNDNSKYVLMTFADLHLANRNDDLAQFSTGFLTDVNALIQQYQSQGLKVYGLTLGDQSWDAYWYSNNFGIPEAMKYVSKINCTTYNIMGNHDNDPYMTNDWMAENAFRKNVGPSYYSFNLGKIHYIVLDDIQYLNTGGSDGVIGERDYNGRITENQLSWLKKDLATLTDPNQQVAIAMHIPLHSNPVLSGSNQVDRISLGNGSELLSCLERFNNVTILSGHTHINYTGKQNGGKVKEYNTAAVCATWWWTGKNGYADNHICKDGTPGGYGVWEVNGEKMTGFYKSIGFTSDYQFRSYDLNEVMLTAAKYAPKSSDELFAPYCGDYNIVNKKNEVLINVWGFTDGWDIEVSENGKLLTVERVNVQDPLHIISYEAKRLNVGATPTSSFLSVKTAHMFKTTASGPETTLNIKVTDNNGHTYTQTMERPKAFSTATK